VALPTLPELKAYLRIETNEEDALCAVLLTHATAMLEQWMDVPIVARSRTVLDMTTGQSAARALVFPGRPIGSVTVVNGDNNTVDPAMYLVDAFSGLVYGKHGFVFANGPYTVTATCGLSLRADYAQVLPLLSQMILDIAADLYQRRTPAAANETGAGTSISWDVSRETVARVMKSLRVLRLAVAT
jgi:uncharacterized phiE125 gp8 family phage protein